MKRIFFISIIGLALFSGACSKKNNPAAEQYQKAEELYRQGDYARAKVAIDSIAKIDPRAFDEIRAGMQLMRRVDLSINERNLADNLPGLALAADSEILQAPLGLGAPVPVRRDGHGAHGVVFHAGVHASSLPFHL